MLTRSIQRGEVFKQLTSPGCFLPPPDVIHPERIPEAVDRSQVATRQLWFPPSPVRLSVLEDVYVAGEGLVFTSALDVLDVSVNEHTPIDIERFRLDILTNRARLSAARLPGTFLLCRKPGARNYGHWLTELLPKAWLAREHWPGKLQVMIQAVEQPMRGVVLDTLRRVGFELSDVLGFDEQPFRVERLLVIDGLTVHGAHMSPLVVDCLQDVAGRIAPGSRERILVTRGAGAARSFTTEAEVVRAGEAAGFCPVNPATLPFAEQVALFKGARRMVGAMGAGMANVAFAMPGSEVCIAAPGSMPDTFFWFLSGLRGLRYTEVRCRSASPGWDGAIVLDPEDQAILLAEPASAPGPAAHAELEEMVGVLEALFDPHHYMAQRGGDLARADALLDYLETGWRMGLNPSGRFDTDAYLLANEDVMRAGVNPLEHYVRYGFREGRQAYPVKSATAPPP